MLAGLIVTIMVLFTLLPLYWVFITAFKPLGEFQTYPPTFWPTTFTLENFTIALTTYEVGSSILDSFIIALGTFVLSMSVGVPAAYSLARFNTGGDTLSFNILSFRFMPPIVPLVALYLIGSQTKRCCWRTCVGSILRRNGVFWSQLEPNIQEDENVTAVSMDSARTGRNHRSRPRRLS